jgi:hypothetical protein
VPPGTTHSGNILTMPLSLPVPWGQRSLTVVCESNGEIYDGDCTPNSPLPKPYPITLVPRKASPQNPPYINWDIH